MPCETGVCCQVSKKDVYLLESNVAVSNHFPNTKAHSIELRCATTLLQLSALNLTQFVTKLNTWYRSGGKTQSKVKYSGKDISYKKLLHSKSENSSKFP